MDEIRNIEREPGQATIVEARGFSSPKSEMFKEVMDYFNKCKSLGILDDEKILIFVNLAYVAGHATGYTDALSKVVASTRRVEEEIASVLRTFESLMDDMQVRIGGVDDTVSEGAGADAEAGNGSLSGASRWVDGDDREEQQP